MLNFLNKRKFIVFDIGSQKIAAISYKVENNKPMIIDMEFQKNQQNNQNSNTLSINIKKIYEKVSKTKDKYSIYCNITDPRVIYRRNKSEIRTGKLGISKKDIRKIYKKCIFDSSLVEKTFTFLSINF